ncbi:MAG: hypothetical protein A2Y07_01510 [Planctomycetes bacterium GWF2_50_10]|nr:MAG: hypothetical protein A2Y07_01510 [Planctomycetes bacterium GWF2_50_10]
MKLSISAGYGLLVMAYIAEKGVSEVVLARELATNCRIPPDYLSKILQKLVRAGVLRSRRGPHGGFATVANADKISFLDIVQAIDGQARVDFKMPGNSHIGKLAEGIEKICIDIVAKYEVLLQTQTLAKLLNLG